MIIAPTLCNVRGYIRPVFDGRRELFSSGEGNGDGPEQAPEVIPGPGHIPVGEFKGNPGVGLHFLEDFSHRHEFMQPNLVADVRREGIH